jgi:hypothetical protein
MERALTDLLLIFLALLPILALAAAVSLLIYGLFFKKKDRHRTKK